MYPWGGVTLTSKPNFEKVSMQPIQDHLNRMIFYATTCGWCLTQFCACQTDSIRLSSFWPEAMALQPWIQKVKKNEKEETKGPPQKMLCTPYEKQLKKMPGDLTMLKDISV